MWKCRNVEMWKYGNGIYFLEFVVRYYFALFHWILWIRLICNVLISMCLCLQSCEFMRENRKILQIEWSIIRNAEINRTHIIPNDQWCVEVSFISTITSPPKKECWHFLWSNKQHQKLYVSIASTWSLSSSGNDIASGNLQHWFPQINFHGIFWMDKYMI